MKEPINKQPIMNFETEAKMRECASYWIDKLQLTNWFISFSFANGELNSRGLMGECEADYMHKIAKITIEDKCFKNFIIKTPIEVTLVHEILHCKFIMVENNNRYESALVEIQQHTLLQEMAMALVMTKYNIDTSWFLK